MDGAHERIMHPQPCTDQSVSNPHTKFIFTTHGTASSLDPRSEKLKRPPRDDNVANACVPLPVRTVFISYFPDPLWPVPAATSDRDRAGERRRRVHAEQACVLELVSFLQTNGVQCVADILLEDDPPDDWSEWLEEQLLRSDFVLMVMTPAYSHFLKRGQVPQELSEVTTHPDLYEVQGQIIYTMLTHPEPDRGSRRQKFIPIFLNEDRRHQDRLPLVLRGSDSYALPLPLNLRGDTHNQGDLENLYSRLTKQNRTPRPMIGSVKVLEPRFRHVPTPVKSSDNHQRHAKPAAPNSESLPCPVQPTCPQPLHPPVLAPDEVVSIARHAWREFGGRMEQYEDTVTELFLTELSERLGDLWKPLVKRLNVSVVEVQNVIADHSGQNEQAFQALLKWQQAADQTTHRRLCEVFIKMNCRGMIKTVVDILSTI